MILNKRTKKLEDGSYESSWSLSEEDVNFLLSYAINDLLGKGLISEEVMEQEQLGRLDISDMARN